MSVTVKAASKWDGRVQSYLPGPELDIDPSLRFCEALEPDLDPITFEVVRHALWNINIEHGEAIIRVSGSPQAVFSHDFNPAMLTATGEYIFTGPYIQVHAGVLDGVVKWTLENRVANPGIDDGDMFLSNDPWIGAHHQEDVVLTAPVFWEGELLCWVANVFHQHDLGGITPGGYCPDARDAFDEPGCIPPIKMVERGVIRADVEAEYRRRSREPELLGLDLRAMIAGCNVARERVLHIAERHGVGVVRACFEKIIGDSERTVGDRLERLPDGKYRAQAFIECKEPGDRGVYRGFLTATKRGRTLTITNEGTDPQTGAINTTLAAWRSAILSVLNPFLCFDLMYAVGGALRCVEFDPVPGTITCANFPAAVSNTSGGALMSVTLATACMGKMLSFDSELSHEVYAVGANSAWPLTIVGGTDAAGTDFATVQLDAMGGGYGAYSWRDGINTGGMVWDPKSAMPNVEYTEQYFPVLYLYRREQPDSGGAGQFRGGIAGTFGLTLHGAEGGWFSSSTSGVGIPTAQGFAGGFPGVTTRMTMAHDGLRERLAAGDLPADVERLGGERRAVQPKESRIPFSEDDAVEIAWGGSGGQGDPLLRDPARVHTDVLALNISLAEATATYGVVLADGAVDEDATAALRSELREARAGGPASGVAGLGDDWKTIGNSLALLVLERSGEQHFACRRCRTDLGPTDANFKQRCTAREVDPAELGPLYPVADDYVDEALVVRQSICPGCLTLLDSEICHPGEAPVQDIELEPGWLGSES
jgi:N-methylhydantoinase B